MSTQQQSSEDSRLLPVTPSPVNWATQELTGFLAAVTAAADGRVAMRDSVERAAVALEAEAAALVWGDEVAASVGFPADPALELAFVEVSEGRANSLVVPGLGTCPAIGVPVGGDLPATLVVARAGDAGFAVEELHLARAMARVLGLSLRMFRLADEERRQRHEAETQAELSQRLFDSLQERQELLERLARIQRSIAHGAPREEVLDAICRGAQELMGDDLGGLRLLAADDPCMLELVASTGQNAPGDRGDRAPIDEGVGGQAITTGRIAVSESCQEDERVLPFRDEGVQTAMAAPVHEHGRIVGSLIVGSFSTGRRYSSIERDMLIAFADHASMALSDSRRMEALREADADRLSARFRSLVQASSEMVLVLDPSGRVLFASPSVERTLTLPETGIVGAPIADVIHPDDRDTVGSFVAEVSGQSSRTAGPAEWRMCGRDGAWLVVETTATAQPDDPDIGGIVLNARDVTERKRLEAELRQSQRLETIGRLAGGIAHDFNNYLSVIAGYASLLSEALPDDSNLRPDAAEIELAAERTAQLTSQLLVFSHNGTHSKGIADVGDVLEGMTSLLGRTLGEDVELVTEVERPLNPVRIDASQVEQVIVNLAVNARDAMPSGGRIEILLDNAGDGLRLRVRDTGHGMSPGVAEHAVEPFFSTKSKNRGGGLGLSTVYGIATRTGGTLEISSALGEGTTVTITLPGGHDEPPDQAEPEGDRAPAGGGETILVVEDEDAVRRLACRILKRQGYQVLDAENGREAIVTWERHAGKIDLLLTDVVMPGMSGKELARRLETDPVYMSGYTDDMMLRHGMEGVRLVEKPFDASTLLTAVRGALDA